MSELDRFEKWWKATGQKFTLDVGGKPTIILKGCAKTLSLAAWMEALKNEEKSKA
jgi:hypothetical protein